MKLLGRPVLFTIPAWLLRMLLGEMSQIILASQRVSPEALYALGFDFHYPSLTKALEACLV